jgi:hypothetical protein
MIMFPQVICLFLCINLNVETGNKIWDHIKMKLFVNNYSKSHGNISYCIVCDCFIIYVLINFLFCWRSRLVCSEAQLVGDTSWNIHNGILSYTDQLLVKLWHFLFIIYNI